jgi:glutathione synthase/RimK-type ligase-like ATP-grasp enzyme
VGIAASPEVPELDDSWPLIRDALDAEGMEPTLIFWTDPQVDWSRFSLVMVNYVWGFVTRRSDFLAWASLVTSLGAKLVNPLPVLEWGSDKTYLRDLADDGVPIVPTTWVAPGENWLAPGADYVVKPSVGSGALMAARYVDAPVNAANEHVRRMHGAGFTAMVQPYQSRIDHRGETDLIFLGGTFSHAICKRSMLRPNVGEVERLWEHMDIAPTTPRDDELALGETVLATVTRRVGATSYARVDVTDADDGQPVVLEVELVEPALYLPGLPSATRLARGLRGLIER